MDRRTRPPRLKIESPGGARLKKESGGCSVTEDEKNGFQARCVIGGIFPVGPFRALVSDALPASSGDH